jgi:hypothetical protein
MSDTKITDEVRKEAEKLFQEKGFKDHDWGNFFSGFIAGYKYFKNKKGIIKNGK